MATATEKMTRAAMMSAMLRPRPSSERSAPGSGLKFWIGSSRVDLQTRWATADFGLVRRRG